jgi:hypothetical protein
MVRIALHRSVAARVLSTKRRTTHSVRKLSSEARITLAIFDRDLRLADLGERIVPARVVAEREGALVGDVVAGVEPILAQHHRVGRDAADLGNEAGQMPGDLRVDRPVIGDRLRLAELIDLHEPRG